MAATLCTAGAAEGGHDGVDPDHVWRALKGVGCVLARMAYALGPAGGVFGIVGSSRRCAFDNLGVIAEIGDGGVGGPAGLGLACHNLDHSGRVLVRVGDGRPVSIGNGNNLICRSVVSTHCPQKPIYGMRRPHIELGDLPEDVLHRVFSKLQLNEVVRTSVLSSKWGHMWTISSKLSLDCIAICGGRRYFCGKQRYTQKFIDGVNTVLQQLHGKVVEELEVKVEFDSILVDHLNKWINFAVSSHMKNLALDLAPYEFMGVKDRYMFPIELFNSASISRIRHIQLSCVSFRPRSLFRGFPNLKKLDLHLFDVSRMDLDEMLSGCAYLEWLSFIRCHVNDELRVKQPLSRLLYLRIAHCSITKVELRAENLKTFVYHGGQLPINLGQVKQLETAELRLYGITFEYVLTVFPDVLQGVQNVTLRTSYLPLETPLLLEHICSFSQLKFLRLFLFVNHRESDNILSLASFLRAAPLIEELEMHFDASCLKGVGRGPLRSLPRCSYSYLRKVHITGFNAIKGQLEFLVDIVENAPVLKVLTISPRKELGLCQCNASDFLASRASVRSELTGKILPGTEVYIL
ncbi:F-box/FBD/LRR-repeat protein At1g13570-like [Phragmites australis]|uniref:F-box/FBD/LRR-repeat protein At1g13570-like n=1 Tax=Phragmites australis TaxID=29695 RepID=UPI002D787C18|nr:F-box/FBD/LRR-repeat protein At1g13570-like [Phragmites australis]